MNLKKIYYALPNKLRTYIGLKLHPILGDIEEKFINSNSGNDYGLNRNDRIAIVKYSDSGCTVLELTKMDKTGKALATSRLNTLQPGGMTNIWDGLYKALEILRLRTTRNNVNSAIFLLTDGEPNIDPPRGYIPTLKSYCDKNGGNYPGIISTFGFGYSLNSQLLETISKECNGTYAFIPDSGLVGTVFENALANTLILRGTNATLSIEPLENTIIEELDPNLSHKRESWGISIKVGNIQYGQNRNFVLKLSTPDGSKPSVSVTLKFNNLSNNNTVQTINVEQRFIEEESRDIIYHTIRQKLVSFISFIMSNALSNNNLCKYELEKFIAQIKTGYIDSNSAELLKDIEGQIRESVVITQFSKWGRHYLPSLKIAHELQQCNNFKDPGVQIYGGNLFQKIRDKADEVFLKIPAPTPSLRRREQISYSPSPSSASFQGRTATISIPAPPVDMSAFSNRYGGCFHGSSKVELSTGKFKFASEIKKGDKVKLGNSTNFDIGEIECVAKTLVDTPIQLMKLSNDLILTYWHPVKINGVWKFPCDIESAIDCSTIYCEAIYSFVIKSDNNSHSSLRGKGKGIVIGNIECATLGHGILNESVISHPFYGTERVIENLKKSKTYYDGLVVLKPNSVLRSSETNLVCGLSI
jgi:hypothetical protein